MFFFVFILFIQFHRYAAAESECGTLRFESDEVAIPNTEYTCNCPNDTTIQECASRCTECFCTKDYQWCGVDMTRTSHRYCAKMFPKLKSKDPQQEQCANNQPCNQDHQSSLVENKRLCWRECSQYEWAEWGWCAKTINKAMYSCDRYRKRQAKTAKKLIFYNDSICAKDPVESGNHGYSQDCTLDKSFDDICKMGTNDDCPGKRTKGKCTVEDNMCVQYETIEPMIDVRLQYKEKCKKPETSVCTNKTKANEDCKTPCLNYFEWSNWGQCSPSFDRNAKTFKCERQRKKVNKDKLVGWHEVDEKCKVLEPDNARDDCLIGIADAKHNENDYMKAECSTDCTGERVPNITSCHPKPTETNSDRCIGSYMHGRASIEYSNETKCKTLDREAKKVSAECSGPKWIGYQAHCKRDCVWGEWYDIDDHCRIKRTNKNRTCVKTQHRDHIVEPFLEGAPCIGEKDQVIRCPDTNCSEDCKCDYTSAEDLTCARYNTSTYERHVEGNCIKVANCTMTPPFGAGKPCDPDWRKSVNQHACVEDEANCTAKLTALFADENEWVTEKQSDTECGTYQRIRVIKKEMEHNLIPAVGSDHKVWCNSFKIGQIVRSIQASPCPGDETENKCRDTAKILISRMCVENCGKVDAVLPPKILDSHEDCGQLSSGSWNSNDTLKGIIKSEFMNSDNPKICPRNPCATKCISEEIALESLKDESKSASGVPQVFTSQGYTKNIDAETNLPNRCGSTRELKSLRQITEYAMVGSDTIPVNCKAFVQDKPWESANNYFQTEYQAERCNRQCVPYVWESWTDCSATCGIGSRTRKRDILFDVGDEEQPCDVIVDTEPCMFKPCDDDIENNYCLYLKFDQVVDYRTIVYDQWIKVAGNASCKQKKNAGRPNPRREKVDPNKKEVWQWKEPRRVKKIPKEGTSLEKKGSVGSISYVLIIGGTLVGLLLIGIGVFFIVRNRRNKQVIVMGGKKDNLRRKHKKEAVSAQSASMTHSQSSNKTMETSGKANPSSAVSEAKDTEKSDADKKDKTQSHRKDKDTTTVKTDSVLTGGTSKSGKIKAPKSTKEKHEDGQSKTSPAYDTLRTATGDGESQSKLRSVKLPTFKSILKSSAKSQDPVPGKSVVKIKKITQKKK